MTVSVQCVHCHKRYNAPASMAGKKVKCKHCAQVFEIPADAPPGTDASAASKAGVKGQDSAVGAPAGAGSRAGGKVQETAGASRAPAPPAGKLGHPSAGFA